MLRHHQKNLSYSFKNYIINLSDSSRQRNDRAAVPLMTPSRDNERQGKQSMEKTVREFMENLLEDLKNIDYIKPEDIPNIALYMDQVTTFMDEQLAASKRHEDDKILTKTMINNYAKNNLLPPPEKKKYSREHVLTLLFIYYFKNILSISDIQSILNPITDRYFGNSDGFNMQDVYNEVFALEKEESQKEFKDLAKKYIIANNTFQDFPEEDQELLHAFAFICQLSYDVYIKKMIIEQMIDEMNSRRQAAGEETDR
jgi:DNA-binding transcriptional MerR regulator